MCHCHAPGKGEIENFPFCEKPKRMDRKRNLKNNEEYCLRVLLALNVILMVSSFAYCLSTFSFPFSITQHFLFFLFCPKNIHALNRVKKSYKRKKVEQIFRNEKKCSA